MMATDEFKQCAERLKAVADPERLRILHCLFAGPKNVSQISAELEEEIVNVSHHLAVRRGRFIEYALHPEVAKSASKSGPKKIEFGCCRIDLTDIS
jgi:DNA-binding transcriptional ArsR family regulator